MTASASASGSANAFSEAGRNAADDEAAQFQALPTYSRSLLRITVPVVVTLASNKQPVGRILELGPGAILHFDKPYDQPLTLSVGRCDVAVGEAVKVGEKFGLRISSMLLPEEKFKPVVPQAHRSNRPATRS